MVSPLGARNLIIATGVTEIIHATGTKLNDSDYDGHVLAGGSWLAV